MDRPQSIMEHLGELRTRIIYSLIAAVVGVGLGWTFVPNLYRYIMGKAPVKVTQIGISEVFMVQFHMGVWLGLIIASPFILYQLFAFVVPALKPNEKRMLFTLLPAGLGLFAGGFLFSFFFIVPAAVRFFMDFARNNGADVILRPSEWQDLIMQFCLPMGLVFELPVLVGILASLGIVGAGALKRWRKVAVLAAVVVGAFISPGPSVIDQMMMTVPILLLYEVSIWLAVFIERRRARRQTE